MTSPSKINDLQISNSNLPKKRRVVRFHCSALLGAFIINFQKLHVDISSCICKFKIDLIFFQAEVWYNLSGINRANSKVVSDNNTSDFFIPRDRKSVV